MHGCLVVARNLIICAVTNTPERDWRRDHQWEIMNTMVLILLESIIRTSYNCKIYIFILALSLGNTYNKNISHDYWQGWANMYRVGKNGSHTQRFTHYAKFSWFKIHVPMDGIAPNLAHDIWKVYGCIIQKIETPIVHSTDLMVQWIWSIRKSNKFS